MRPSGAEKQNGSTTHEAGKAVIEKVAKTHESLPAMVVIAIKLHENPEIREEDFAAGYMGIQNLSLVAHSMGLGTHIKTGAIMDDPAARAAVGLPEGERILATINIGEPDGVAGWAGSAAGHGTHDVGGVTLGSLVGAPPS